MHKFICMRIRTCMIYVYYISFLQKVLESIPTLSKVAASLFFQPKASFISSSARRNFNSRISTSKTLASANNLTSASWEKRCQKGFPKLEDLFFFLGGGGEGKQKRTKILPESLAVPNRFRSIFSLCCFMLYSFPSL